MVPKGSQVKQQVKKNQNKRGSKQRVPASVIGLRARLASGTKNKKKALSGFSARLALGTKSAAARTMKGTDRDGTAKTMRGDGCRGRGARGVAAFDEFGDQHVEDFELSLAS